MRYCLQKNLVLVVGFIKLLKGGFGTKEPQKVIETLSKIC